MSKIDYKLKAIFTINIFKVECLHTHHNKFIS